MAEVVESGHHFDIKSFLSLEFWFLWVLFSEILVLRRFT